MNMLLGIFALIVKTSHGIYRVLLLGILGTGFCLAAEPVRNVRIVDYGADMGSGEIMYRGKSPERKIPYASDMGGSSRHSAGITFVSAWPYSFDIPLNPPGLRYDTTQKNAILYGGLVTLTINNPDRGLSEGHLNANHEFRDDYNFMALQGGKFKPGEEIEAYAFWFWKKNDFLNGGDKHSVSFNADSRIAVHVSRYWGGVHAGRWVVQDAGKFYVSEKTFGSIYKMFTEEDKENPIVHHTQVLMPTSTKWAVWEPKEPYGLTFDHTKASFQEHSFKDIAAVGFLLTRELSPAVKAVPGGLSPNQPIAVKWYAFRCDAVVGDGNIPSTVLPMVQVERSKLLIGKTEVSFLQWEKIRRSAVTNQYCRDLGDLGYTFQGDGSIGSMRIGDISHRPDEPVTDITWLDAVAWCNALSEFEGYEPVYYTDDKMSDVFRRTFNRDQLASKPPIIYWKQNATGYRLPTQSEWQSVAVEGGKPFDANPGWTAANGEGTTHPVGTRDPGPHGLFDLNGNVWEYVWPDSTEQVDPNSMVSVTVLGGDFHSPADPGNTNPGFQVETPFASGSYNIGFRVVLGPTGTPKKAIGAIPTWTIARDQVVATGSEANLEAIKHFAKKHLPTVTVPNAGLANASDFVDPLQIQERNKAFGKAQDDKFLGKLVGDEMPNNGKPVVRMPYPLDFSKTEIPYSVWNRVRGWALSKGYRFNYPGDIGSMRISRNPSESFTPDEPVTFVSWYDAVAWCNALSELMGERPSYYVDSDKKGVLREVLPFRLETYTGPGYPNPVWKKSTRPGEKYDTALNMIVFFDPLAGGYRLPMYDEFRIADGSQPANSEDTEWTEVNSGGRTHPVGTKAPQDNGLQDMKGNVLEWGWDQDNSHLNSMVDYRVNGIGYFFEKPEIVKNYAKGYYKEYTGSARSLIGFRVAKGKPE